MFADIDNFNPPFTLYKWAVWDADAQSAYYWSGDNREVFNTETPSISAIAADRRRNSLPMRTGILAGRDVLRGFTINFKVAFTGPNAKARHAEFVLMWAKGSQLPSGALWAIGRNYNIREFTLGRPGSLQSNLTYMSRGYISVEATWDALVPFWIRREEGPGAEVTVQAVSPSINRGMVLPFTTPWSTTTRESFVANVTLPASADYAPSGLYPRFVLHGPAQNPEITFGDKTLILNTSLVAGETATIDTLPGAQNVVRSDGQPLASLLGVQSTRLNDFIAQPSEHISIGCTATGAIAGFTQLVVDFHSISYA